MIFLYYINQKKKIEILTINMAFLKILSKPRSEAYTKTTNKNKKQRKWQQRS